MELSELRIGNIVSFKDNPIEVKKSYLINRYHYFEPIPLIEEWLVKFGFLRGVIELDPEVAGQRMRKIEVHCFDFTNSTRDEKIFCRLSYSSWNPNTQTKELLEKKFYYIHQLQNLYFAITGEELKEQ